MNVGNILTLIGGLGLFLYGMRVMSDSIEKAAGAKMRSFLAFFTKNKVCGNAVRYDFLCHYPVIQCDYSNGSQLCKCRSDESVPGSRSDHGSQYRYHHHITAGSF